ncbi:MAG: hypothetical protein JWR50_1494 [Mucilaginibacter sp.]|nr:hypothetical protein [Mucilaginibacter sp.]
MVDVKVGKFDKDEQTCSQIVTCKGYHFPLSVSSQTICTSCLWGHKQR